MNNSTGESAAFTVDKEASKEYLLGVTDCNDMLNDPEIWIADTAATVHMSSHRKGLENIKKLTRIDTITMGNGTQESVQETADVVGCIRDSQTNETKNIRIQNVSILPNGQFNLFSISQMLNKGWKLAGDNDKITISKGDLDLHFDIKIPTARGMLFGIRIFRSQEILGVAGDKSSVKIAVNEAHELLGHMSFPTTRAIAQELGWELTKGSHVCDACAAGKAKQKNIVSNQSRSEMTENSGRIFLDISSVRNVEFLDLEVTPKPYWRIIVDERTQLKFSEFFGTKNGMIEPTCQMLQEWGNNNKSVKIIRCHDAGENRALEARLRSSDWKIYLKFEYTGRDTPQRNHLAKIAFHTIANRGRAILNSAHVPRKYRFLLWREAFKTATLLDGLTVITIGEKTATRYEHWGSRNPEFSQKLRKWGEAGAVKLKNNRTPKIFDRGQVCMFVGYPDSHACDTYRMWDPRSTRVHVSRDIIWMGRMFFSPSSALPPAFSTSNSEIFTEVDHTKPSPTATPPIEDDPSNDEALTDTEEANEDPNIPGKDTAVCSPSRVTRSGRVIQPPARFRKNASVDDRYKFRTCFGWCRTWGGY